MCPGETYLRDGGREHHGRAAAEGPPEAKLRHLPDAYRAAACAWPPAAEGRHPCLSFTASLLATSDLRETSGHWCTGELTMTQVEYLCQHLPGCAGVRAAGSERPLLPAAQYPHARGSGGACWSRPVICTAGGRASSATACVVCMHVYAITIPLQTELRNRCFPITWLVGLDQGCGSAANHLDVSCAYRI